MEYTRRVSEITFIFFLYLLFSMNHHNLTKYRESTIYYDPGKYKWKAK